jgi:hypothetical protein
MNHQMSPASKAVLAYVAKHPDCTFTDMCTVFCSEAEKGKGSVVERFRARVSYLVSAGHLKRVKSDNVQLVTTYQTGSSVPQCARSLLLSAWWLATLPSAVCECPRPVTTACTATPTCPPLTTAHALAGLTTSATPAVALPADFQPN